MKNKPKELWERNPYGKVPVLMDGEVTVYESAIINEYLDEKYPQVPLVPKDLGEKARMRIWVDFCNTRLQQAASDYRHGHNVEKALANLEKHLLTLEQEMTGREYLVGSYSLADLTYIPFFVRQPRYGFTIDESLPNVKAWMERLLARPSLRAQP